MGDTKGGKGKFSDKLLSKMPFGRQKKKPSTPTGGPPSKEGNMSEKSNGSAAGATDSPAASPPRSKLVFHCQQAQGSPTGIISGFSNVKELYARIAEAYSIDASEILFCTLNTHKIDMNRLLGGQIGLEDFIFAHVKDRPKEVEVEKSEDALGLTITDNGAGYAFIKRIKEGSIMDRTVGVELGDHIEKINGTSLVGCRHFEVAKMLKEIKKGSMFTIRLISPKKTGFSHIGPNTGRKSGSGSVGTGKETLRLRAKGPATVEVPDDVVGIACEKINGLLESFMGINDSELAQSIWELGCTKNNPSEFMDSFADTDMAMFGFSDEFVLDLWGAISDAKGGRLNKSVEINEKF